MRRQLKRAKWAMLVLGLVTAISAQPTVSFGEDEDVEDSPLLTVSANRFGSTFELITVDVRGENAALVLPFRVAAENACWSPDSSPRIEQATTSCSWRTQTVQTP